VTSVLALAAPWATEPYLVAEHAHQSVLASWTSADALVAVIATHRRGTVVFGLGAAPGVASLLTRAVEEITSLAPNGATLVRGAWELLTSELRARLGLVDAGSDWDWMWTRAPLAVDPAGAVRLPPGADTVDRVADCLVRAYPDASTAPDDDRLVAWWAVPDIHDAARLIAVVGAVRPAPGLAPHLVSLGVDPTERARGHADRVLAAAVRDCLDITPSAGAPLVSLGMYAANGPARRVYRRLGFVVRHEFTSRDAC